MCTSITFFDLMLISVLLLHFYYRALPFLTAWSANPPLGRSCLNSWSQHLFPQRCITQLHTTPPSAPIYAPLTPHSPTVALHAPLQNLLQHPPPHLRRRPQHPPPPPRTLRHPRPNHGRRQRRRRNPNGRPLDRRHHPLRLRRRLQDVGMCGRLGKMAPRAVQAPGSARGGDACYRGACLLTATWYEGVCNRRCHHSSAPAPLSPP